VGRGVGITRLCLHLWGALGVFDADAVAAVGVVGGVGAAGGVVGDAQFLGELLDDLEFLGVFSIFAFGPPLGLFGLVKGAQGSYFVVQVSIEIKGMLFADP
jgi:hypothetical protein